MMYYNEPKYLTECQHFHSPHPNALEPQVVDTHMITLRLTSFFIISSSICRPIIHSLTERGHITHV